MLVKEKIKLKQNLFVQAFLASLAGFFVFSAILTGGFYYDLKIQNSTKVKGETREDSQPSIPLILPADGTIQVTQSANGSYLLSLSRDSVADHHIQDGAIEGDELARKSVHTYHLASGSITERMIEDGAIDTRHFDDTIRIRKYLRVGDGNPSHFTLGTGDAYISDNLEVDGDAYFDETIYVRDSSSISTMTSNTLQTTTANISNILSNSHLHIKGRLPDVDYLKIDDFVKAFFNPSAGTIVGADYDNIPTFQFIDGAGDLYVSDDLEVNGTIYGNISGAYSPSGDLDMDSNLITNIGNAGTDFTATGGLSLADGLTITGNITLSGTVDGKDIATYAAMLNEEEIITANWVNTANPWADNEVADNLTIIGGSIDSTTTIDKDPIITLSGDLSGNITLANLSGGTLAALVVADSVTLATDTTGYYIATLAGNSQIEVSGSGSENAAVSLSINTDSIGDSQLAYNTGQHLTTASSPTFAGLTLSGNLVLGANTLTTDNTGLVSNLNADLLDGQHGSYYAPLANLSGTAGYLSKFTGDNSIGNSVIYESGGNIGIGTESPGGKFHLYSNTGLSSIIETSAINGANAGIVFNRKNALGNQVNIASIGIDADGTNNVGKIFFKTASNAGISSLDSSPDMVIGNGNVGIGTTSPVYVLDISNSGYQALRLHRDIYDIGAGIWQDFAMDNSAGEVTIYSRLQTLITDNANGSEDGHLVFRTMKAGTLTEQMRIDNTGNVGIGTTAPTYKLYVNGTAGFESTIYAPNIGTGEDNSVLVLGSSGNLVTDEIDSRVWGSSLLDYSGTNANYVPYFSDANTLTQSSIYYDGTNVGIGTTSPEAKLEVYSEENEIAKLRINSGTDSGQKYADFYISQYNSLTINGTYGRLAMGNELVMKDSVKLSFGNHDDFWFINNNIGGNAFEFWTTDSDGSDTDAKIMSVPSDTKNAVFYGNVGIGTTSPEAKLHINGGTGSLATGLAFGDGDTGFYEDIDDRIYVTLGGCLEFVFDGSYFYVPIVGAASLRSGSVSESTPAYGFRNDEDTGLYNPAANNIGFTLGGSEKVRITNDGNVGIGTTSPGSILHIESSTRPQFTLRNPTAVAGRTFTIDHSDSVVTLKAPNLWFDSSEGYISFLTSTNEKVRITNTGNVGIGTTGPNYKLDVNGGVRSNSSDIYLTGLSTGDGTALYLTAGNQVVKYSSSRRYKEDFQQYDPDIEKLKLLDPQNFKWNQSTATPGKADFGLIAEDVYDIFPELVKKNSAGEIESVDYSKISVILLKGFQYHDSEIESIQKSLSAIGADIDSMESKIASNKAKAESNQEQIDALLVSISQLNQMDANLLGQLSGQDVKINDHETRIQALENEIDNISVAGENMEMPEILHALDSEAIQFDSEGNLKVKKVQAGIIELEKNEDPPQCDKEIEGSFYYNFEEKAFLGCDGESWKKLEFVPENE